ncbi:MAG: hypothetical protein KGH69_04505 [Candidatus Micrarchaeota archaeon]|nr:hypothetical protein [Candidatus Micrarchaeota archaeon]
MANRTAKANSAELRSLKAARREDTLRAADALFRTRRGAAENSVAGVTSGYLYKLFSSRQFSHRIRLSLGSTERHGVEAGFIAFRQVNSQFTRLTMPEKGSPDGIIFDILGHEQALEKQFGVPFLQIAAFHTHTERDTAIPSRGDLINVVITRPVYSPGMENGIAAYPATIEIMCAPGRKGIEMIAVQKSPVFNGPSAVLMLGINQVDRELAFARSGNEAVEILEGYSYRAFSFKANRYGRIGKDDAERMALMFAYSPAVVPSDADY